jgi:hypothetical protein
MLRVAEGDARVASLHKEVESLRGGMRDADNRMLRLKQLFRERADKLRDAVCRLTGWRMDMHFSESKSGGGSDDAPRGAVDVTLRSTYADSSAAYLHTRIHGEAIELLDSTAVKAIAPGTLSLLTVSKSFPAFFAQCILDGFGNKTSV